MATNFPVLSKCIDAKYFQRKLKCTKSAAFKFIESDEKLFGAFFDKQEVKMQKHLEKIQTEIDKFMDENATPEVKIKALKIMTEEKKEKLKKKEKKELLKKIENGEAMKKSKAPKDSESEGDDEDYEERKPANKNKETNKEEIKNRVFSEPLVFLTPPPPLKVPEEKKGINLFEIKDTLEEIHKKKNFSIIDNNGTNVPIAGIKISEDKNSIQVNL
jgi:hypothetical protein